MSDTPPPPPPAPPPTPPPRHDPPRHDPPRYDPPWPPPEPDWRHDAGDADEAFRVPFGVGDALLMILWTVVAQFVVAVVAAAIGVLSVETDLTATPVTGLTIQLAGQVLTLVGLAAYLRARGMLTWRLLGPIRPRGRHVGIGIGLGLVGVLLVQTIAEMVERSLGPFDQPEQFALQVSASSTLALVLVALSAVLFAPVIEELVFRSLLFQSIRQRIGLSGAMVLQALVFAFIHVELVLRTIDGQLSFAPLPPAIFGLVALALWLAGAFHRVGSLVVPVTAHATYNLAVVVLQVFVVPRLPA